MEKFTFRDYVAFSNSELLNQMKLSAQAHFSKSCALQPCQSIIQSSASTSDASVSMIGSTTSALKPLLTNYRSMAPTFLWQPKLRTQNVSLHFTDTKPMYASHFNGIGAWYPYKDYGEMCYQLWDFLIDVLGIPEEFLVISACASHEDVWRPWESLVGAKLHLINDPERFLWDFGSSVIGKLRGVGCYIEMKDSRGVVLGDIASVELISDENGTIVCAEFGLGFETTIARIRSTSGDVVTPIWCTAYSDVCMQLEQNTASSHFVDCLNTIGCLLESGLIISGKNRGFGFANTILKRYLRALKFYWVEVGKLQSHNLSPYVHKLSDYFRIPDESILELGHYLHSYAERYKFFTECVEFLLTKGYKPSCTIPLAEISNRNGTEFDTKVAAALYELVEYDSSIGYRTLVQKYENLAATFPV